MYELNHRFSIAIREIEQALRDSWPPDRTFAFTKAAFDTVREGRLKAQEASFLEAAWTMRNLLRHETVDGQDPFEASAATVRTAERIRNKLTGRVPTVESMLKQVETVSPTTPLSEVASLMAEHDYSCVPVYETTTFVGAIDSDAILSWIGPRLAEEGLLEDAPVSALRSSHPDPPIEFRRTDTPQREVVATFEATLKTEAPLAAVLLTSDGTQSGQLRGIVTPWDVPSLHR